MKYFTYIIKSLTTGRHYIGHCSNMPRRLKEHNTGKTKSTKHFTPWILIRCEEYQNKQTAYRREFQIKSYKGGEAFKKLIT